MTEQSHRLSPALAAAFWAKVNKEGPTVTEELGPCWLWKEGVDGDGQPLCNIRFGATKAYRVAWVERFGPLPTGVRLAHTCEVNRCVNPDHLRIGPSKAAMAAKLIDLTGQRFGRWTVLRREFTLPNVCWVCRCNCGTERPVQGANLRNGTSESCGCLRMDLNDAKDWTAIFWSKVDKVSSPNGCWLWAAGRHAAGYGSCSPERFKDNYAHRASWIMANGPIPDGMLVCHKCDNPPCVNPEHLFLGTDADNMTDKVRKGRQPRGSKMPRAILTEAQVADIKARLGTTSLAALGREYGVAIQTISSIRRGTHWKHVEPARAGGSAEPGVRDDFRSREAG